MSVGLEAAVKSARAQSEACPRLLLFNVKYSPNLGDGLLAECLEREVRAQWPQARVESVDMAGRDEYLPGRAERAALLAGLNALPQFARQALVKLVLGGQLRRRLAPNWRARLCGVDAVVLGGGNLLSDVDLNFPLKVETALAAAREVGAPIGVFGVGVSDNWSPEGARLFACALGGPPLFYASVRDAKSGEVWRRRLDSAEVRAPSVVGDPGLLTSAHFPAAQRAPGGPPTVGLGVMHPTSLHYHSNEKLVSAVRQREWLLQFAAAGLAQGWTLRLFSNGSPEDEAYLQDLAPAVRGLPGAERAFIEPRFSTPADLARFASGLGLMFAHRLHANIAAYSYAVPQIGFTWDAKLQSFLAHVGRSDCLATMGVDPIESALALGARAWRDGIDRATHAETLARARDDVGRLVAATRGAIAGARQPRLFGVRETASA